MKRIKVISFYKNDPDICELLGFYWIKDLGWCFYFDVAEDCGEYGTMDKDFVEVDSNFEAYINKFLSTQPKIEWKEIKVDEFYNWLQNEASQSA